MALRVKTAWFRKDAARDAHETASVIAATLWRLADRLVENLARAGYDIVIPARGFTIIAETVAFGLHACDRMAHARLADAERSALVQAIGERLAGIMEENVGDTHGEFIALLNRRSADYASFDFAEGRASFPALRYLAQQVREAMSASDQPWVMDQLMDIEAPELLGALSKSVDGLLARARYHSA